MSRRGARNEEGAGQVMGEVEGVEARRGGISPGGRDDKRKRAEEKSQGETRVRWISYYRIPPKVKYIY